MNRFMRHELTMYPYVVRRRDRYELLAAEETPKTRVSESGALRHPSTHPAPVGL